MADKMMRISGRDSEGNAKAIKTDTEGNIGVSFASSDVAIPVDLQYVNLNESEALPVKNVRNKVSSTLHPRSVRSADSNFVYLDVPANAIGAIIKLKNHGMTGMTFANGQGIRLQTVLCIPASNGAIAELSTSKLQNTFPHVCMFYPGWTNGALTSYSTTTPPSTLKGSGIPIAHMRIGVRIQIDGTVEGTGGFDCEVEVDWLS